MWEGVVNSGEEWGGIGRGDCSTLLPKSKPTHQQTQPQNQPPNAIVLTHSTPTKTPKLCNQIKQTRGAYVWDCVSVCVCVRLYMYIIPWIFISHSGYLYLTQMLLTSTLRLKKKLEG